MLAFALSSFGIVPRGIGNGAPLVWKKKENMEKGPPGQMDRFFFFWIPVINIKKASLVHQIIQIEEPGNIKMLFCFKAQNSFFPNFVLLHDKCSPAHTIRHHLSN